MTVYKYRNIKTNEIIYTVDLPIINETFGNTGQIMIGYTKEDEEIFYVMEAEQFLKFHEKI